MIGWIYRIVLGLAWPWFLLDSLRRAGRVPPAYRVWWAQWGRLPPQLPTDAIWLHAVSLGEVRAAGTL
nr:3-deoxy-D-manno-octulosonic acid transferase [Halothiobacillus sp.]